MYWNEKMECMPREEIEQLQYSSLRKLIEHLYRNNEFYRDRMMEHGVTPEDIKCLKDVSKLPFMYKKDLRDNYPTKMFTVPNSEVIRYHVSSGTTGKPTLVGYTKNDIGYWTDALARSLTSIGVGENDVVQVSYGYGLFTGGLGLHYGAEAVGATVLPSSTGGTERQLELMQDLGVTVIACTPSYLIHMITVARDMGIDFRRDTKLKKAILGAEPWTEGMRRHIEDATGVKAYDVYGTSELAGPMFTECEFKNGIHVPADIMYVEIIDPDTEEALPEGQEGELVVTMLRKEAFPLVRYRVKDITFKIEEKCECGRTSPRISRITGRTDDMLIIRGINVFPSQVEHALMQIPEVGDQYIITIDRVDDLDRMNIEVELKEDAFSDSIPKMMELKSKLEFNMKKYLNVAVRIELREYGTLPRFEGKAKRVIDKRVL